MKRIFCLLMALAYAALFWGCSSEERSVTMHRPGVYKGAKDPLLAMKNKQELIDRLKLVQTDR